MPDSLFGLAGGAQQFKLVTPKEVNGALNSATPVTILPAPPSGTKRVTTSITVYNKDTVNATLTVSMVDSGGSTSIVWKGTLSSGDTWICENNIILDTQLKSLTAVLSGAITTSQPDYHVSFAEMTF